MKKVSYKRVITGCLALLLALSGLCLSSCSLKYKRFHTEENIMEKTTVDGKELCAYFFLIKDGSAVLDICDTEGNTVQRLNFPTESEYYASLDFDYAFKMAKFQDMNFDGTADLYVPCSVTTTNLEGMAWLWDSKSESFVLSEELSAIYELTVFPEDELITGQDYSSPDGILCTEYKWEEGKLIKVGEYTIVGQ